MLAQGLGQEKKVPKKVSAWFPNRFPKRFPERFPCVGSNWGATGCVENSGKMLRTKLLEPVEGGPGASLGVDQAAVGEVVRDIVGAVRQRPVEVLLAKRQSSAA